MRGKSPPNDAGQANPEGKEILNIKKKKAHKS